MLARLERIETLEREGAAVPSLLAELRELVREATEWAERERDPRAPRPPRAALAEAGSSLPEGRGLRRRACRGARTALPAERRRGRTVSGRGLVRLRLVARRARVLRATRVAATVARNQPGNGLRLLLLDFGAARKLSAGTWGTIDFSNTTVSNADILGALKASADGYHTCHVRGAVDIVYGNSNYDLSDSGMSTTDAWYAGYHQSERAEDLPSRGVEAVTHDHLAYTALTTAATLAHLRPIE